MRIRFSSAMAAVAIAAVSWALPAAATTVLYRNDLSLGTDQMAAALSALGLSVTTTSGDLSMFTLSNYNLVVYFNQNSGTPAGDTAALDSYIAGGGILVPIVVNHFAAEVPTGVGGYTGNTNLSLLTVGSQLDAGLMTNPLALTNPGWGIFSYGITGSVSAGTFENGDSAIIIGNGGQTIFNGFLNDTFDSTNGPTLYENEINLATMAAAVPEPATVALFGSALAGFAWLRRRSRKS
jgi:hypothetical protein